METPPQESPSDQDWLKTAQALMNDQCWCWGQDVLYPRGNLLIRYGLERIPGQGADGRTVGYTASLDDRGGVWLRGSGMFYSGGSGAGVFLGRFDMRPRMVACDTPPIEQWTKQGLTAFPLAETSEEGSAAACLLVPEACAWIAAYELWIEEAVGVAHREDCLDRWKRRQTPADEFARRWRALGLEFGSGAALDEAEAQGDALGSGPESGAASSDGADPGSESGS